MIQHKLHVISPYIRDKTRLLLINSGIKWGENEITPTYIYDRLNSAIEGLSNEKVYEQYNTIRSRTQVNGERTFENQQSFSDLHLPDVYRHNNSIEGRYRKYLPTMFDIMRVSDPNIRLAYSMSRGYERHLLESIIKLHSEFLNRQTIKPFIGERLED